MLKAEGFREKDLGDLSDEISRSYDFRQTRCEAKMPFEFTLFLRLKKSRIVSSGKIVSHGCFFDEGIGCFHRGLLTMQISPTEFRQSSLL